MDANALSAIAAAASAVAAVAAWRVARDAVQVSRATLFAQILKDYGADQMGDDLRLLHAFYDVDPESVGRRYGEALSATPKSGETAPFADVVAARRRVSQYFKNLGALCDGDLIEKKMVAKAFGARVFRTCLDVVAPMDEAHSQAIVGKPDDPRWQEFYQDLFDEARRSGKV
jgi:hypothetical protein